MIHIGISHIVDCISEIRIDGILKLYFLLGIGDTNQFIVYVIISLYEEEYCERSKELFKNTANED